MSERRRSLLVGALLAAALVFAVAVSVRSIESELLARSQLALAAAGIPFYDITMDGRDAVLRGFVASNEHGRRILDVVAAVPGIRAVHDELVVERIADSGTIALAREQPTLRLQIARSTLRVGGRLTSATESAALLQALRAAVPRLEIVQTLQSVPGIAPAPWLADASALAAVVAAATGDVRLLIQGDTAILSGEVRDAAARERLVAACGSVPGLAWRFDLFSLDGSVSGAGVGP